MKNTAKYACSFSRNSSFLRGLFYCAAPRTKRRNVKPYRVDHVVRLRGQFTYIFNSEKYYFSLVNLFLMKNINRCGPACLDKTWKLCRLEDSRDSHLTLV